jgi:hypothetical protein
MYLEIIQTITAVAVITAVIQIYINRKQLYLSTITKCISDFRNLQGLNKDTIDKFILWKYIDLTNEELFYFKHDYLPRNVAVEWVDGIIDYIPIKNNKDEVLNKDNCIKELLEKHKEYLSGFPRIINAFSIKEQYDFDLIYNKDNSSLSDRMKERRRLIDEIIRNNNRFNFFD